MHLEGSSQKWENTWYVWTMVGLNKRFTQESTWHFLLKRHCQRQPLQELPCSAVSCRPCTAEHPRCSSGLEVTAAVSVLSRLFMQCPDLLGEQGHTNMETREEGVVSPQQSTRESQCTRKGKRRASNSRQQQGRSGTTGRVCRGSILTAEQSTLLWEGMETALMCAPALLSWSH